jgi:hypothetical protein
MQMVKHALVALVMATACDATATRKLPATTAVRATQTVPITTPPPIAPSACVDPTADAARRLKLSANDSIERTEIDLDNDAVADAVVRVPGGREYPHLLYRMNHGCGEYVGTIEAFDLGCAYDVRPLSMCDLHVETWLMHGDRKRCRWHFVNDAYSATSDCTVIIGPRKLPVQNQP